MRSDNEKVHVLGKNGSTWAALTSITESGIQEDPFYNCDIGDIVRKFGIWKKEMSRIHPYYSVKCNDSLIVLKTLAALGTNFSCVSKWEIRKLLDIGVNPNRMIFANPAKIVSHLQDAVKVEVNTLIFDNESELYKIRNIHPNAQLLIRIRGDDLKTRTFDESNLFIFGCHHIIEAPGLLQTAKKLGLNVKGVSFDFSSDFFGITQPSMYKTAIEYCKEVFNYAKTVGYDFTILDIGGGYPGTRGTSISKFANVINSALNEYFSDPSVKIIAEPGRFFVTSAYTMACNIYSIRKTQLNDDKTGQLKPHNMYYINVGVYCSFNVMHKHEIKPGNKEKMLPPPFSIKEREMKDVKLLSCSVWGPTCDGVDQPAIDVLLPELQIGDWILFGDMGAYTVSTPTTFNGFAWPVEHFVAHEDIWELLKEKYPFSEDDFVFGPPNLPLDIDFGVNCFNRST